MKYILSATAALFASPGPAAVAQTAPAAAVATSIDPVQLAEARKLLDVIMPPSARAAMMATMVRGMMGNLVNGLGENPQFKTAMTELPGAKEVFDEFVQRQTELATKDLTDNLPGMIEAMSRAYARRFTVGQMHEIGAFFATPTGRAYMNTATTVFSDPDVAAWQGGVAKRAMGRMPGEMERLMNDIDTLKDKQESGHAKP